VGKAQKIHIHVHCFATRTPDKAYNVANENSNFLQAGNPVTVAITLLQSQLEISLKVSQEFPA